MKLITKHTDYAVRALAYLANRENSFVPSSEISANEQIPLRFIRVILSSLKKNGIVDSKEGPSGGVKLKLAPSKIRLADIIEIFQGKIKLSECLFRNKICRNRKICMLRRHIIRIEQMVEKEFFTLTIEDILKTV